MEKIIASLARRRMPDLAPDYRNIVFNQRGIIKPQDEKGLAKHGFIVEHKPGWSVIKQGKATSEDWRRLWRGFTVLHAASQVTPRQLKQLVKHYLK